MTGNTSLIRLICLSLLCLLFLSPSLNGQGFGGGGKKRIDGKAKAMPIPYINYDRSQGFSFGAVPLLMFNPVEKDSISPSSLVGVLGLWSTNRTWFLSAFGKFYFGEDKWRFMTGGGHGNINYQFYLDNPIDLWIPYNSKLDFFFFQAERKIYKEFYGGVSYIFAHVVSSTESLPLSDTLTLNGIGLHLSLDKRNNPYYPRSGYYATVQYNTYPEFIGNETLTRKINIDYNHYFPTRQLKDVLALRFHAGLGLGDLAFNQQYIVKQTDIRGYTQGEYRGDYLLALQGEYRWNFHPRWGAVGFTGVATVLEALNESDNGKLLPDIGTGIRFRVFPETNFSVGLDVAKGVGDWGIYFQIGEAF